VTTKAFTKPNNDFVSIKCKVVNEFEAYVVRQTGTLHKNSTSTGSLIDMLQCVEDHECNVNH